MSLKETLVSFIDNTGLAERFSLKQPTMQALRKPLLKGIETTRQQFESGQTRGAGRWWTVSNGVVRLTVKVKGDTFDINGVATNHMPEERFLEFLDRFKQAVDAGEFDDELKNKGNGDAKVHIGKASRRSSISPEAAKERGRKAAESRKRNRAAAITGS